MLNPNIPSYFCDDPQSYILNSSFYDIVYENNQEFNTQHEYRLDNFFTEEIKLRLKSLNFPFKNIQNLQLLDLCCGTGFLSYHLKKIFPDIRIDLIDISPNELSSAKDLLGNSKNINFFCGNALDFEYPVQYDIIIGNSFLHHFPNIPEALNKIHSKLSTNGLFISLHEPTLAALDWESGSCRLPLKLLLKKNIALKYRDTPEKKGSYTDIWIFTAEDLYSLLKKYGYTNIVTAHSWAIRPYITAKFAWHLSEKNRNLKGIQPFLLKSSILLDYYLSHIFPSRFFGSCAFIAQKDNK